MTTYAGPSPGQQKTLDDIKAFIAQHGFSPSVAELAEMAGIANNAVAQRIDALVRKGCISRRPGASRSLMPVNGVSVGSSDEQRHPLYLTYDQLAQLSSRLKSTGVKAGDEPDELLMVVDRIRNTICSEQSQSA